MIDVNDEAASHLEISAYTCLKAHHASSAAAEFHALQVLAVAAAKGSLVSPLTSFVRLKLSSRSTYTVDLRMLIPFCKAERSNYGSSILTMYTILEKSRSKVASTYIDFQCIQASIQDKYDCLDQSMTQV